MRYVCQICGYIYDDDKEKVPFESLPDTWKCPLCGAAKQDFKPIQDDGVRDAKPGNSNTGIAAKPENSSGGNEQKPVQNSEENEKAPAPYTDEDLKELSIGQMSALCSNLARGCEKQYKEEEAGLFRELADYFASITPPVNDASVENIAALIQSDIDRYTDVRATADAASDRGAARVCVWGEKVTRMLSALVRRYLEEGEAMLKDTSIWVCTVCGFIYIGDDAPELCPVCKVPSWKFEKIEGRY